MPSSDKLQITELEFDQIRQNLKTYLSAQTEFQDYDFEGSGMAIMLDLLAYNTHYTGYYANMLGNEMFLDSSSLRESVVSHSKHLNVHSTSKKAAKAKINITFTPLGSPLALTIDKGTQFSTSINSVSYIFTTNTTTSVPRSATGTYSISDLEIVEGRILNKSFVVNGADTTQRFVIPNKNIDLSTLSVRVQTSSSNTEVFTYTDGNAADVTTIKGTDKVYFAQEVEDELYEISFGDGTIGSALSDGNIIFVEYIVTQGSDANFAAVFTALGNVGGQSSDRYILTTSEPATGGADIQSIESLRFQAPKLYQAQKRATTKFDYQALLLEQRPDIESVKVYGGEDADTVQYGRVFVAVKIFGNNFLNENAKESIKRDILKSVNVVTVEPVIVDPIFFYLIFDSTVNYDPIKNLTDEDTLKTNIDTSIKNYIQTNLEKFDQKFRYSQLVQGIDNTNDSIRNNKTLIKYQQRMIPTALNVPENFTMYFTNQLEKGSVHSTTFTGTDGNTYCFVDDSAGKVMAARCVNNVITEPRQFLIQADGSTNHGTIDYDTGKVVVNKFTPVSIVDGSNHVKFTVTPEINNSDITPLREQILTYDSAEVTSITINMVAETLI